MYLYNDINNICLLSSHISNQDNQHSPSETTMANANIGHFSTEDYFKIPELYSRTDWGARQPKITQKTKTPVIYLIFKKTDTDRCHNKEECMKIVREIQRQDMDEKGLPDIHYNFLIGGDGTMYEGRGWDNATEPYPINKMDWTIELNKGSLLIGLIGDSEDKRQNQKQEFAVLNLVGLGADKDTIHENAQFLKYEEVSYNRDPYDDD